MRVNTELRKLVYDLEGLTSQEDRRNLLESNSMKEVSNYIRNESERLFYKHDNGAKALYVVSSVLGVSAIANLFLGESLNSSVNLGGSSLFLGGWSNHHNSMADHYKGLMVKYK
jgi:hypothetical protein